VSSRNTRIDNRTDCSVKLTVNGDERDVAEGITVEVLLQVMNVPPSGTAVARNSSVVKRSEQRATALEPGDRIEIIRAVAGG